MKRIPLLVALLVLLGACGAADTRTDVPEAGDAGDPDDARFDDDAGTDAAEVARRPHGDPCTRNSECEGRFCVTTDMDPSFVGGYCSAAYCDPGFPEACGGSAACFDTEIFPPMCARRCESDADCRTPDYVCVGTCIPDDFVNPLPSPGLVTGTEAPVQAALAGIDDARAFERIAILAGEVPWASPDGDVTLRSRALRHPDHALAADYLEAELRDLGLEVRRLEYTALGVPQVNLQADIAGTEPELPPVLVTAHWDSIATDTAGWTEETDAAPGAVDNASGVAAALEIASLLADPAADRPRRTVRIVLFDGEERGLYGSGAYVAALGPGDAPYCVLNTDMVGWTMPPTQGRFWYLYADRDREVAALGLEAIARFVPTARAIASSYPEAGFSDHAAFHDAGLCAVTLSSWPRHESNHTVNDTSAVYDRGFYALVLRSAVAAAAVWAYR